MRFEEAARRSSRVARSSEPTFPRRVESTFLKMSWSEWRKIGPRMMRVMRAAASAGARCRVSQSMDRTSPSMSWSRSFKLTTAFRPDLVNALAQSAAPERSSARMRSFRIDLCPRAGIGFGFRFFPGMGLPQSRERGNKKAADNDTCSDKDSSGSGRRSVAGIGNSDQSGDGCGVAGSAGSCNSGSAVASDEAIDAHEGDGARADDDHTKPDAEQAGAKDLVKIGRATESKGEEGDEDGNSSREKIAHLAIEIAEQHTDSERKDGPDEGLPGKTGEAGDAERNHREEGSGF